MSFRNRKMVSGQVFHDSSVIRDDKDVNVSVTGFFSPASGDGWNDPFYDATVEFEAAEDEHGNPFVLTKDEMEHFCQVMLEKALGEYEPCDPDD